MNELVQWLRAALECKELHPIEIAAKLHHDFVLIHPFGDGNGRTARILVNYVLMRNGYLPLVVPTGEKDRYLAASRRGDAGELDALTDYLAACLVRSMDRGILAAKGESIEDPEDLKMEIELFKRRQMGVEEEVERKTNESMLRLYETSLKPIFRESIEALAQLDSLFASAEHKLVILDPGIPAISTIVTNIDIGGEAVLSAKSIHLTYSLQGFKGPSSHPFGVESQIAVDFSDYHYTISVGGKIGEKRRYGRPILQSERKAISQEALAQAFAQIKKLSGQDSSD